jgi:hypothetical protein
LSEAGVAASVSGAQSEEDGRVFGVSIFVVDRSVQSALAANHLDVVVTKEGVFLLFLLLFSLGIFEVTGRSDQLGSGLSADGLGGGGAEGGKGNECDGEFHAEIF